MKNKNSVPIPVSVNPTPQNLPYGVPIPKKNKVKK